MSRCRLRCDASTPAPTPITPTPTPMIAQNSGDIAARTTRRPRRDGYSFPGAAPHVYRAASFYSSHCWKPMGRRAGCLLGCVDSVTESPVPIDAIPSQGRPPGRTEGSHSWRHLFLPTDTLVGVMDPPVDPLHITMEPIQFCEVSAELGVDFGVDVENVIKCLLVQHV